MKLEIDFVNNKMCFHSKIPFGPYAHTTAAALIDYTIAYIATKMAA